MRDHESIQIILSNTNFDWVQPITRMHKYAVSYNISAELYICRNNKYGV